MDQRARRRVAASDERKIVIVGQCQICSTVTIRYLEQLNAEHLGAGKRRVSLKLPAEEPRVALEKPPTPPVSGRDRHSTLTNVLDHRQLTKSNSWSRQYL